MDKYGLNSKAIVNAVEKVFQENEKNYLLIFLFFLIIKLATNKITLPA